MQGLVNYGSDSEDGGSDTEAPVVPPLPTKASSSSLSLPPPKTSSSLSLPPLSASSVPAKKPKGPVRIMLDLPAPSSSSSDEPPAKKLKFTPSSSSSAGLSGLAAMLPKPKNESVEIKLEKASGGGGGKPTVGVGAFMPHSVGKGKGKKTGTGPAVPSNVVANEVKEVEQEEAPAEDFFGLGSVTSSSSSSLLSRPLKSSAPSISSAPTLATPARQSTFGDPPTDSDPYPGFTQLPSGEWVARDAKTYELWMASMQQQSQEAPKGFEEKEMDRLGVEEFDAGKVREAWANRPNQVVKPGQEDKEGEKAKPVVKAAKLASGRARGKHQLSTLLNEAIENRQELEDRIAQGRANRKGAGNKYGF